MLTRLTVRNLALIESIELSPCDKLNVLSGETGAGKSIIVDGIMLLLGARYDKSLLRYGCESGFVEGVFDSTEKSDEILKELVIDSDDDCVIITRKFFSDGKNEIRINGRSATTSMLKQLTAALVDIYGQNESQTLIKQSEHLKILDYYVREHSKAVRAEYSEAYSKYKEVCAELKSMGNASEREREIDLLSFQTQEIENSGIYENEEEEIIERRNIITSAEKIYAALGTAASLLGDREEGSACELVSDAEREMSAISDYSSVYGELYERLKSVSIELEDICDGISGESDGLHFDMNELDEIEKRLSYIRALKRKYGSYSDMLKFKDKAKQRLEFLLNADENYEKLARQKSDLLKKLYELCTTLHNIRKEGANDFSNKIVVQLHELAMENAEFKVEIPPLPQFEEFEGKFSVSGADSAEFYLSPNAGQPLKPLIKIISGGEMSRFMLALKVVSNRNDDIPTMIFDEIDSGISGITGRVVAKKLAEISRKHQVLCVTHLPQIAAMADSHFYISKSTADNNTVTTVTELDTSGMIAEISRLSGSSGISEQSDINAGTIKKWSDDYKATL